MYTRRTQRDLSTQFAYECLESDSYHSDVNVRTNESCWEEMVSCLDDKKDEKEKGKQVYEQSLSRNVVEHEVINDSREPLIDTRYAEINTRVSKKRDKRFWSNRNLALTTNPFYDAPTSTVVLESNEKNELRRLGITEHKKTTLKLWTAEVRRFFFEGKNIESIFKFIFFDLYQHPITDRRTRLY